MYEKKAAGLAVAICCIGIVGPGCATQLTAPPSYPSASSSAVDSSEPPTPVREAPERPAGGNIVEDSKEVWGWISESFREHPKTWIAGIVAVIWAGKQLAKDERHTPNTDPSPPPQPSPPSCFGNSILCGYW